MPAFQDFAEPQVATPAPPFTAPTNRTLGAPSRWRPALAALGCLLVGYFVGREHVKYEIRESFASIADNMRDAFKPTAILDLPKAKSLDNHEFAELNIESIDTRTTETNDIWHKEAWILKVRNDGDAREEINAEIEFLDKDGFVIDHDWEYRLIAPPHEVTTFRGTKLVTMPGATRIDSVHAKIRY